MGQVSWCIPNTKHTQLAVCNYLHGLRGDALQAFFGSFCENEGFWLADCGKLCLNAKEAAASPVASS